MNDTIQIANDSLKVAISTFNGTKLYIDNIEMWKLLGIFMVVVVVVITIAQIIFKICSQQHEEKMHNLNRIKEERKQLLDFCYDMAKKKESDTKEDTKEKDLISLNQIRHECWLIIKTMNGIRILGNK